MITRAHALLARYLADEMQVEEIKNRKRSLDFGSVLPDRSPRQRMMDHEFTATWEYTKNLVRYIESKEITNARSERAVCRKIGMVLHYLADYFTCPHNPSYGIRILKHGRYENKQARYLLGYMHSTEAEEQFFAQKNVAGQINGKEDLFSHIERMHGLYLQDSGHTPESDCKWIMDVCACTAIFLLSMVYLDTGQAG